MNFHFNQTVSCIICKNGLTKAALANLLSFTIRQLIARNSFSGRGQFDLQLQPLNQFFQSILFIFFMLISIPYHFCKGLHAADGER